MPSRLMHRNDDLWVARNRSRRGLPDRLPTGSCSTRPCYGSLTRSKAGVEVQSKRLKVLARRVVVAMMPSDTRRIAFTVGIAAGTAGPGGGVARGFVDQG